MWPEETQTSLYNEVDPKLFDSPSFSNFADVKKIVYNFLKKIITNEKGRYEQKQRKNQKS